VGFESIIINNVKMVIFEKKRKDPSRAYLGLSLRPLGLQILAET
jgi:hypothetical protein